jgi:hypothetical protein
VCDDGANVLSTQMFVWQIIWQIIWQQRKADNLGNYLANPYLSYSGLYKGAFLPQKSSRFYHIIHGGWFHVPGSVLTNCLVENTYNNELFKRRRNNSRTTQGDAPNCGTDNCWNYLEDSTVSP